MLARRDELSEAVKSATGHKDKNEYYRKINAIGDLFGLREELEDELVDKWERELDEGIIPDLDEEQLE